jgi:dienelactone hydrolase
MNLITKAMLTLGLLAPAAAFSGITESSVTYEHEGTTFRGRLYIPETATTGTRTPAVVVFPEWWGNNDYCQRRAREIAEFGLIALAADLYGNGTIAKDRQEAAGLAMPLFSNRPLLRARANAAIDLLRNHELVDKDRIVATGYCLGGATSLELARTGAPIAAAFSFHGALNFPDKITSGTRAIPVYIFNGKDDPSIPVAAVNEAEAEFRAAGFNVTVVQYEGAVHSFTNPAAGSNKETGSAYDEAADKDSHSRLFQFLERLKRQRGER